jgi:hypothetical protein
MQRIEEEKLKVCAHIIIIIINGCFIIRASLATR